MVEPENGAVGVVERASDALDESVLLQVLSDVENGDFGVRMPLGWTGVAGKIADRLNSVIAANQTLGEELARVSRVVGKEGKLSQRVALGGSDRVWSESVASVNGLIEDLVRPTTDMQRVIGAVADGDLSKKITADVHGEVLELKNTINAMVDQLNRFISEVTRVAREVGTEGKLGQAAAVTIEVGGVWKDLTDNVNLMAGNLTGQVRDIAEVTTAVANGDLSKKITADVKGEFLQLKNTVNAMVDQLNRFASEVTRVAREVGVEGKLGGQAQSAEVAGVWKDLTDNVNQLAANLTNQVRAIADVATAVTEGDLTRQVGVEASGEVAVLKDKLNEMIRNLRETTRENTEQDWLKTNLERFTRMLQGQRDLATVSSMILSELAPLVSAQHGVFYTLASLGDGGDPVLMYQAGYGYKERKHLANHFRLGEGLVGQCAQEKERILLTEVPSDYVRINSGLGESAPLNIIVLPILFEGSVRAVVELASFSHFSATHQAFLDQLTESIGLVLNTIEANTITENLLTQSQSQAHELQARQEELSTSNEDLASQAARLAEQYSEVERKNQEVVLAKRLVEEKAEQLAVSSKYKSEFFSNMSHELRTPLNSLLILAGELEDNEEKTMNATQVEYASVIRSSGNDLLRLLDDILDLAKVESGTVTLEIEEVPLSELRDAIKSDFSQVAKKQGLRFSVELSPDLPSSIVTDGSRLRQILKNLISNAFKFTEEGGVTVDVRTATSGWNPMKESLNRAQFVLAFDVSDTGIGITPEQQQLIFEAFAQADGSTARQYGGTGLGLSICRELVRLLGGEIALSSAPETGSTFTVYLPRTNEDPAPKPTPRPQPPALSPAPRPQPPTLAPPLTTLIEPSMNGNGTGSIPDLPALKPLPPVEHPAGSALAGMQVMVVDDDPRNIVALSALLKRVELRVLSAESGEHGVTLLRGTPDIDLVFVDIMMPGMDGYATMRAMRELPVCQRIPLVAYTAKVEAGERERCLDAGASAYVTKPVDTAQLLEVLGEWLPGSDHGPTTPDDRPAQTSPSDPVATVQAVGGAVSPPGPAGEAQEPPIAGETAAAGNVAGMKVLVVDDDFRNIFALSALLRRADVQTLSADCGSRGVELLSQSPDVDLVLVDIMMPGMDGYATMRAMRELPSGADVPLVAFTAKTEAGERQRCLDAGGSGYVPKPVDTAQLLAVLGEWYPPVTSAGHPPDAVG
jgi:signal transduction histidine kinase/response regulator RpfG family c-di-GMP phosphodiesterase/HAMP domain-containing protein